MSAGGPWRDAQAVTPADTPLRRGTADGIYVWTDGNLEFTTELGTRLGPYAVVAGQVIPIRVKQINSGTTSEVTVGFN